MTPATVSAKGISERLSVKFLQKQGQDLCLRIGVRQGGIPGCLMMDLKMPVKIGKG